MSKKNLTSGSTKHDLLVFGATGPQWARASHSQGLLDHKERRTTVGRTPLDK